MKLGRQGRGFEVREWIAEGMQYQLPLVSCRCSPFIAAVRTKIHSLVEVYLREGIREEDRITRDLIAHFLPDSNLLRPLNETRRSGGLR